LNSNALIGISQFNLIQFKNWIKIQLKKKVMQIDGEGIEDMLMNMVLEK
jgi:hypothetical protein